MHSAKPVPTPMNATLKLHVALGPASSDPTLYKSTIGVLQYLTYTRSDIAFAINKLNQYLQQPIELHQKACKRVLHYLKCTVHHGLHFTPDSSLHLQVYTDTDWASSIDDRRSTIDYSVFLGTNLLTWSSRKQFVVSRSSIEAKYCTLAHASTEVAWLCSLFSELGVSLVNTPVIWCDNQCTGALATGSVIHSQTKHIEVDVHYVCEQVLAHKLVVSYVPSVEQVADLFIKPFSIPRFQ